MSILHTEILYSYIYFVLFELICGRGKSRGRVMIRPCFFKDAKSMIFLILFPACKYFFMDQRASEKQLTNYKQSVESIN